MVERFAGKVKFKTGGPDWLHRLVGKDLMSKMKVFDRIDDIELKWSEITDAQVNQLSKLANLNRLSIDGTDVTDAGVAQLSGLSNLKVLSLESTAVTDIGLVQLSRMTGLKAVSLRGTKATAAGVEKLQQALPDCTISPRRTAHRNHIQYFR